jgi:hypothetical protein
MTSDSASFAISKARIVYLLDGDQTGRLTARKLQKWAERGTEPSGSLAYVDAYELFVYVTPHSRTKKVKAIKTRKVRKYPLAALTIETFPETLDVEINVLGGKRVLYFPVSQGSEITDLTLAFVAGVMCAVCPEEAIFRIVSNDNHAKYITQLLESMGHRSQLIPPE